MAVYRHFQTVRTVFCAALAGVILLGGAAMAANERYTVEKVEVDVTAANAVEARNKALDEAQVKAYRMLAERIYGPEAMANFKDPDPVTVSSMVQDFEVTNEQLSRVRYKGVFTVRFRPNAIRHYLPASSDYVATADTAKNIPTLILPYYRSGARTVLWDDTNTWLKAWTAPAATDAAKTDDGLIVPIGDLLDVSQMPDDKALTYDSKMLDQMMGRYGADEAAILIAVPKEEGLEISVYQAQRSGPAFAQTMLISRMASEDDATLHARAADRLRDVMRGNWKKAPPAQEQIPVAQDAPYQSQQPAPVAAGPAQNYNGRVMFASVQEWVRLKQLMESAPGVRSVVVRGLKPREAQVAVTFAGDPVQLATAMQQAGVIVRTPVNQPAGYGVGMDGAATYEFSSGAARY